MDSAYSPATRLADRSGAMDVAGAAVAQRRPATLPGIQIMRGIAAFMVVLHHSWLATGQAVAPPGPLQEQLISVGAAGVDLFFVISGFIMIYVSRSRFGLPGAAGDFLVKRAIRIAPLYWIISTGMLVLWASGTLLRDDHFSGSDLLCSYLFAPCVQPHGVAQVGHPLLDQGWTLSYEWYFYLLFAVWLGIGSLRSLVLGAPVFFSAVVAVLSLRPASGPISLFFSDPLVFEFCFGLVLGYLYLKGYRFTAHSRTLLVAGGAIAMLACGTPPREWRWLTWGVPAAIIIFSMLHVPSPRSTAGRALVWLGDISYSLYLFHGLVTMTFDHYLGTRGYHLNLLQQFLYIALMCALAVVGGGLLNRLLERPVTSWLQAWHAKRKRMHPA